MKREKRKYKRENTKEKREKRKKKGCEPFFLFFLKKLMCPSPNMI